MIIGITGTAASGKGTVAKYLVNKYHFKHYSVRNEITLEVKKRGLKVNRDTLVDIGNDLRKKHSPSYLAENIYKKAKKTNKNCVVESLRNPQEVFALRKKGDFILLAVNAKAKMRYQRMLKRGIKFDQTSYAIFLKNEKRERHSKDPTKQNIQKCMTMADYTIINNGNYKELTKKIDKLVSKLN